MTDLTPKVSIIRLQVNVLISHLKDKGWQGILKSITLPSVPCMLSIRNSLQIKQIGRLT